MRKVRLLGNIFAAMCIVPGMIMVPMMLWDKANSVGPHRSLGQEARLVHKAADRTFATTVHADKSASAQGQ
jgi:hypothetical protein